MTEEHRQAEKLQGVHPGAGRPAGADGPGARPRPRGADGAAAPRATPLSPAPRRSPPAALRFAHRYLPEGRVGGDFFTVNQISDTQAGVLICDVMGHGVPGRVGHRRRARAGGGESHGVADDPGAFLGELNQRLHHFFEDPADLDVRHGGLPRLSTPRPASSASPTRVIRSRSTSAARSTPCAPWAT